MDRTVVDHILVQLSKAVTIDHYIQTKFQFGDSLVYNNPSIFQNKLKFRINQVVPAAMVLTANLGVATVAVLTVDLVLGMEMVHAVVMVVIQMALVVKPDASRDPMILLKLVVCFEEHRVILEAVAMQLVFLAQVFMSLNHACDT